LICFAKSIQTIDLSKFFAKGVIGINIYDPENEFWIYSSGGKVRNFSESFKKHVLLNDTVTLNPEKTPSLHFVYSLVFDDAGESPKNTALLEELLSSTDHLVQNAGSEIHSPFSAGDLDWNLLASRFQNIAPAPRRAWCGAGVIFPVGYLKLLGGFDESFFLYYEDTEFSVRGLKKGIMPVLFPSLRIFHEHSMITNKFPRLRSQAIWRSRQMFITRTSGWRYSFLFCIGIFLKYIRMLLLRKTTLRHFLISLMPEVCYSILGSLEGLIKRPTYRNLRIP
jgi:GT2 family glycosyltransferase